MNLTAHFVKHFKKQNMEPTTIIFTEFSTEIEEKWHKIIPPCFVYRGHFNHHKDFIHRVRLLSEQSGRPFEIIVHSPTKPSPTVLDALENITITWLKEPQIPLMTIGSKVQHFYGEAVSNYHH